MSGIQQVGVQATFDTQNFVNGVNTYIQALDRMVQHTRVAASSMVVQPQIVGLTRLAQDVQDTVYQFRLMRAEFQKMGKQQTPFAQITPQINAMRGEVRKATLDLRGTGNMLNHVSKNAKAAAASLNTAAKQATGLASALSKIQATAKNVNVTVGQTAKTVSRAGTAFETGIGVIFGTAVLHGIRGFTEGFVGLSKEIANNIGFWERLTISIGFFETRSLGAGASTLSYADRVRAVGQEARETTLWIQQLAIASPFTSQDVGNVFRVSQAYGLTTETAKELLPLMLDLGSAAGFNSDVLERVALALGQVQARGKLTGEEIRQLGNAGVPIRDILVKNLGIANSEFEDFVENGELTAEVVMPLIIESLKEFKGASEEVTRNTLTGLANAFKELVEIGQVDLFQGIADSIKTTMREIVDALQDPKVRPALVALGQFMGTIFVQAIREIREALAALIGFLTSVSPETYKLITLFVIGASAAIAFSIGVWAVGAAFAALTSPLGLIVVGFAALFTLLAQDDPIQTVKDFFSGLVRLMGRALTGIGNFVDGLREFATAVVKRFGEAADAGEMFGSRLMQVFAFGMEQGLRAVSAVMRTLGSLLSFWMEPHSPPRIAPNLDDWGTQSANVWLEGWTKADFGILSDMTGTMRDFLSSMVAQGDLAGELNVVERVIGTRTLIQRAIDQIRTLGQVSSDTFAQIRATAGAAGEVVVGYLQRYQVLAAATRAVEIAQAALNAITAKYTAILKPLQDRLDAINDTQAQSEETKEIARLQGILASRYVTDARKKQAALELETLLLEQQIRETENRQEAEEGVAEAVLDNAESQQGAAEDALDIYEEQVQLSTEANELEKDRLAAVQAIVEEQRRLEEEAKKALTPLERQLEIIKLQQEELRSMIEIFRAQQVLADENATDAERAAAAMTIQREQGESILRGIEIADLGGSLAQVKEIQIVMADITSATGSDESPFANMVDGLDDMEASAINIKNQIKAWDTNVKNFRTTIDTTFASLLEWFNRVNDNLPPFLKLFTGEEKTVEKSNPAGGMFPNVEESFFDFESSPLLKTGAIAIGILTLAKSFGILGTGLRGLAAAWGFLVASGFFSGLAWLGSGVLSFIIAGFNGIGIAIATLTQSIGLFIGGILAGLTGLQVALVALTLGIAAMILAIVFNIGGMGDKTKEFLDNTSQFLGEWLTKTWEKIDQWAIDTQARFAEWASGIGTNITDWLKEHIDFAGLKDTASDILEGILGFDPMEIARLIDEAGEKMVTEFKEWMGIASPSTVMQEEVGAPMLSGIVQAFIDGVGQAIIDIGEKMGEIIASLVDPIALQEWMDSGTEMATSIITGITDFIYNSRQMVWDAIEWLRTNVFDTDIVARFRDKAGELGSAIAHGIYDGVIGTIGVVEEAVKKILGVFPQGLQDLFWMLFRQEQPTDSSTQSSQSSSSQSDFSSATAAKPVQSMGTLTDSLDSLNRTILLRTLPTQQYTATPTGTNIGTTVNNYNLTTRTNAPSTSVVRDFNLLRAMAGA